MGRATVTITVGLLLAGSALPGALALAHDDDPKAFEVTVTNLTRGQQFTPILVASHDGRVSLFELGEPAIPELQTLAEEGNTGPLTARLLGTRGVKDVADSGGLLNPGASVTVTVKADDDADSLSIAAMLIPTNDGFFGVNRVRGPNKSTTLFSVAYDAGSEVNDELCASIPGPFFAECGGRGGGAAVTGGEEGFVHIHAGIHGIGDMRESMRDWRNPVAKITIRAVR